jgi:hypothetical protein
MTRFKQLLPLILSLRILGVFFTLILIFHVLILTGIIPFDIAWGGRLKTAEEMLLFETVSIVINLLMLFAVTSRIKLLKQSKEPGYLRVVFGIMTLLVFINTLGNLYAVTDLERLLFTPMTAISSILSFRSALTKH